MYISKKNNTYILVLVLLSILFFLFYISTVLEKSATFDEPIIIASGNHFLYTGENSFNTENPPFLKSFLAIPSLFSKLKIQTIPKKLLYAYNPNRSFKYAADKITALSNMKMLISCCRIINILLTLVFGFLIYLSINLLFKNNSKTWGILGLALFLLTPCIIANGRLATLDIGVSMLMFAVTFTLLKYHYTEKNAYLVFSGIFAALALLSKYTALLLAPIILIQVFILCTTYNKTGSIKKIITIMIYIFIPSLLIVFLFYINSGLPLILSDPPLTSNFLKHIFNNPATKYIPIPIPYSYLLGLDIVSHINQSGNPFVFWGKIYNSGVWYYYLIIFILKQPIAVLIIFLVGLITGIKKYYKSRLFYFLLVPPIIILICFSLFTERKLGVRYILPIMPYFIICSIFGLKVIWKSRLKFISILLGIWFLIEVCCIYPNYLTYFNQFIGGPGKAYKYFTDSDLDWGQDLPAVKKWLAANNNPNIQFLYYGTVNPEIYGIKQSQKPDYYLISATCLYRYKEKNTFIRFLKNQKPVCTINYSVNVYPREYYYKYKKIVSKESL